MTVKACLTAMVLLSLSAPIYAMDWKPWGRDGGPVTMNFKGGVQAYREGNYDQAAKIFKTLHDTQPEQTNVTYYLAMTRAQQRNYAEARHLYQEVITLDPQGEAAQLAREGLENLPALSATGLDKPPRFQTHEDSKAPVTPLSAGSYGMGMPAATAQAQTQLPDGMNAQDMMMLQQMFGGGNQQSNNANSWMPMMMQQQNPNDPNSMQMNPDMMSTMMMNQMMQNFTLDSGKKDE